MIAQEAPPRIRSVPEADNYDIGDQAVELAAEAGLELDPWQADVLRTSLGLRADDKWAAFEIGCEVSRQNGKGGILEARELAGLFLVGEVMQIHSAHQFDTSLEAFRRLLWLMEDNPQMEDQIKRVSRSHGEEGIELKSGQRIRFRTRTKGGGRGFSGDVLYLDEAMFLPEYGYGALLPILSARPNPQVWYLGSAVDQEIHPDGIVFARVRERGIAHSDPRLAYWEWSLDYETPEEVPEEVLADPEAWAQTNPALGIRISEEHIASELRALNSRTFAVERLGVGDWPDTDTGAHVIDMDLWKSLVDEQSVESGFVTFDVSPDRSTASVAVAGWGKNLIHLGLVERGAGTKWVPGRVAELCEANGCEKPLCDGRGPAASLIPQLQDLGFDVETVDAGEMAQACGDFYDIVDQRGIGHLDSVDMTSALKGAAKRSLGDAWAWSRKNSSVDISPLVASTLAVWGVRQHRPEPPRPFFASVSA